MSEFKPKSWAAPVEDLVKEFEAEDAAGRTPEVQTEEDPLNASLVQKGLLNPNTGEVLSSNKASKAMVDQIQGYSPQGKKNYERTFKHA